MSHNSSSKSIHKIKTFLIYYKENLMFKSLFAPERPILAFDVSNLAYRAFYARGYNGLTCNSKPSGHVFGSFKMIVSAIKHIYPKQNPEIWFALDGCPKQRLKLYPQYKEGRIKPSFNPIPDVLDLIRLIPGKIMSHPNLEADDILALMTRLKKKRQLTIITGDTDLWQFVGCKKTRIWCKDHVVDPIEIKAKFLVDSPKQIALIKALFGDSSDHIKPAVPHLKRKPIIELINKFNLTTPTELLDCIKTNLNNKIGKLVLNHEHQLRLQYKIVKLRTSSKKEISIIINNEQQQTTEKLKKFLLKWKCKSLVDDLDIFKI